ncbi:MAG: P-II family nitrogen regulator [Mariprofundaceae bacterium]|nr:P-II family nitrogen regulator [Mariprofundaceae bacterium]
MHFKLIIAMVEEESTSKVIQAARDAGATGTTVLSDARGEGLKPHKSFFGLTLETQREMLLFLVEEHLSRHILECISQVAEFDKKPGCGVAFQIDVEDVIGLNKQMHTILEEVEEQL